MPKATIEEIAFPSDARGFVIEPLEGERLPEQRNVHVAVTMPGAVRGNHFHERGSEVSVVMGPALVRLREDGIVRDVHVPEGRAYRFFLPPHVAHAFQNNGSKPLLIMAFNTALFDRDQPDVVRDVLIELQG
jgi:dTDP-4-dehydrorhamnose 3,5-epimerase-like enzyme